MQPPHEKSFTLLQASDSMRRFSDSGSLKNSRVGSESLLENVPENSSITKIFSDTINGFFRKPNDRQPSVWGRILKWDPGMSQGMRRGHVDEPRDVVKEIVHML